MIAKEINKNSRWDLIVENWEHFERKIKIIFLTLDAHSGTRNATLDRKASTDQIVRDYS